MEQNFVCIIYDSSEQWRKSHWEEAEATAAPRMLESGDRQWFRPRHSNAAMIGTWGWLPDCSSTSIAREIKSFGEDKHLVGNNIEWNINMFILFQSVFVRLYSIRKIFKWLVILLFKSYILLHLILIHHIWRK